MSSRPTTIELNGKRYDAHTGKVLSAHETVRDGPVTYVKPVAKQTGVALDGFKRRKQPAGKNTLSHAVHKKTERSKTLMRHAVKKPTAAKLQPAAAPIVRAQKAPRVDIDPKRASRAVAVKKSALISKFGTPQKALKAITLPLSVRPEPTAPPMPVLSEHHKPTISDKQRTAHHKAMHKAINAADSHSQKMPKKTTRRQRVSRRLKVSTRTVNVAAASLATLLLVGFIAYQNVPNLSMRVAAARAGVNGNLPGYQPSGFGMKGPISYQPGQLVIRYKSHSDDRQFQISQKSSQWNSEALLENYVAVNQRSYQTVQDSGKTIYIYDNNNATWVDGGVWYQIEGNSALNNDQLLRMAASM